jgi:hypothetical protein
MYRLWRTPAAAAAAESCFIDAEEYSDLPFFFFFFFFFFFHSSSLAVKKKM